jgi:hypothetical protein
MSKNQPHNPIGEPRTQHNIVGARDDDSLELLVSQLKLSCRLAVQKFPECAERILVLNMDELLRLAMNPEYEAAFDSLQVEITDALRIFQRILGDLDQFCWEAGMNPATRAYLYRHPKDDNRVILQLHNRMHQLADDAIAVLSAVFGLIDRFVKYSDSSSPSDSASGCNWEAPGTYDGTDLSPATSYDCARRALERTESIAMLEIFSDRFDHDDSATLYDLIAACCFRRCMLDTPANDSNNQQFLAIGASASATAAVIHETLTLISNLRRTLFDRCLPATADDPTPSRAVGDFCDILTMMSTPSLLVSAEHASLIAGLAAIASGLGGIRARIATADTVVISFTVPQQTEIFESKIRDYLQDAVAPYQNTLSDLGYQLAVVIDKVGDMLEIGMCITLPMSSYYRDISKLTRDVQAAQAELRNASQNLFQVGQVALSVDLSPNSNHLSVNLPDFLFSLDPNADVMPEDVRLAAFSCIMNALALAKVIPNVSSLSLLTRETADGQSITISQVAMTLTQPGTDSTTRFDARDYIRKFVQLLLTEPRSRINYRPDQTPEPSITIPSFLMQSTEILAALTELSSYANIRQFDIALLGSLSGELTESVVLKQLRTFSSLFKDQSEFLAPYKQLSVHVLPYVHDTTIHKYLYFYLTDSSLGLCGLGCLSSASIENDCRIFPPVLAERFASLIRAIGDEPQNPMFSEHPWLFRVHLSMQSDNVSLSPSLCMDLYWARLNSVTPLSNEEFAMHLYSIIATHSKDIVISFSSENNHLTVSKRSETHDLPTTKNKRSQL